VMNESEELLRQAVLLFAHLADETCGNVAGTPCDDFKPRYVCKYHKWVARAKAFLRHAQPKEDRK
jgi:hypothetical protein